MSLVFTGDEIRRLRMANRWSQADLANRLGVTASTVGQWESETTKPSWKNEQAMRNLFEGITTPVESTRLDMVENEVAGLRDEVRQLADLLAEIRTALAQRPATPQPPRPSGAPAPSSGG